jgi:hypothetical protein
MWPKAHHDIFPSKIVGDYYELGGQEDTSSYAPDIPSLGGTGNALSAINLANG